MSRPKKKIVVIIVEGKSDKTLLEVSLSEFFELKYGEDTIVKFAMFERDQGGYGTDITSLYGSNPDKIEMLINKKIILPVLDTDGLYARDITEIVHIIDTDGAFIDDDSIVPYSDNEKQHVIEGKNLYYHETHISAANIEMAIERNHRKLENVHQLLEFCKSGFPVRKYKNVENRGNRISSKSSVAPYSLFYFSCNMDHYTSNEMNWTGSKNALAESFLRVHGDDYKSLQEFVLDTDPEISDMTFLDSWSYIMENCNSLKRHSNLGILFKTLSTSCEM